jgi:mitochondrial enoyl-[acyl-carrier protein] reductase / trans-2-enoyl-CoA reductase
MTMLKSYYEHRGPVPQDVIRAVEFTPSALTSGQALVAVLAAPINPSDLLMLTGQYGMLPPLPAVGGSEGVGRVVEIGPDVAGISVGQTVLLPAGSGTWTPMHAAWCPSPTVPTRSSWPCSPSTPPPPR